MYSVQPYFVQRLSGCACRFQAEVEQLAAAHALTIEGGLPALELQVHPQVLANLEYNLWGEAGVIAIRGKLHLREEVPSQAEDIAMMMKFSLSHDPAWEMEGKKLRVEEILCGEAELFWNIPPVGHVGHIELTLRFQDQVGSGRMAVYVRHILGILTGKMMAA